MNATEEPTASAEPSEEAGQATTWQDASSNSIANHRSKLARSNRRSANTQETKDEVLASDSPTNSGNGANAEETAATTMSELDSETGSIPKIDLPSEIQRAETLLDEIGHRAGGQLTDLARTLFRTAVRAREEAEDIWAEANSIRRGH